MFPSAMLDEAARLLDALRARGCGWPRRKVVPAA